GKILKKPVLVTYDEFLGERWYEVINNLWIAKISKFIEAAIAKLDFDKYVAISTSTASDLIANHLDPQKISVIYPGIETEKIAASIHSEELREIYRKELSILGTSFVYLFFGRPGATKGAEYLIQAYSQITQEIPDSHLIMILSKSPKKGYDQILKSIDELKAHNIHILPPFPSRKDLFSFIYIADCIVIPSLTVGFGLAVVESNILGIPVVATKAGSIPEVISGKYVLVERKSPEAISDGVFKVYNNDYSTSLLKDFNWDESVDQYETIYQELLK
ncbi:MAG: glycosyltransferase family 4 protein, partial [Anaerolineaceae bacterium]|nr:glycosyltransferase family 4 protein [Anaerolineaceae bacterium]